MKRVKTIEEQIKRINFRLDCLRKSVDHIYHQSYARLTRRSHLEKRASNKLLMVQKQAVKYYKAVRKFGKVVQNIKAGRTLITLDRKQYLRFRQQLRKKGFGSWAPNGPQGTSCVFMFPHQRMVLSRILKREEERVLLKESNRL